MVPFCAVDDDLCLDGAAGDDSSGRIIGGEGCYEFFSYLADG